MRVIHIAGYSNSGKTTFISALIPELEKHGPVGVIKHIGHHGYSLPEGKDTTRFFEAGAAASAGIDTRKSILILQENDLERMLGILCDTGVQYAVVEGFKEKPYPKVVIGNVPGASNVILQDPSVEDVLAHIDDFSDLVTPEGFSKEIQQGCCPGMTNFVLTFPLQGSSPKEQMEELIREMDEKIRNLGDISARFEYRGNSKIGGQQRFMIGVCTPDPRIAIAAGQVITDTLFRLVASDLDG